LDKKYWNNYYANHHGLGKPSSFAKSIIELLPEKCNLMELGCGNGRDSFYFAKMGHSVWACDQSDVIINALPTLENNSPHFYVDDVRNMASIPDMEFDAIYARFVLHALSENEARQAFEWTFNHLKTGGKFYSESRSIKDPIFGDGEKMDDQIYKTDHRRRFLDKDVLISDLESLGFTIESVVEAQGLAVYKDSDPVVIRVIATKI
jgi:SAM-dependent methyltransferase|tara:strand:- start:261 stop:878 length:618 start_codon:yes stop_codon:yes gene_type:complete